MNTEVPEKEAPLDYKLARWWVHPEVKDFPAIDGWLSNALDPVRHLYTPKENTKEVQKKTDAYRAHIEGGQMSGFALLGCILAGIAQETSYSEEANFVIASRYNTCEQCLSNGKGVIQVLPDGERNIAEITKTAQNPLVASLEPGCGSGSMLLIYVATMIKETGIPCQPLYQQEKQKEV